MNDYHEMPDLPGEIYEPLDETEFDQDVSSIKMIEHKEPELADLPF